MRHGLQRPPMYGEQLRQGLRELIDQWEQVAVPKGGRYSQRPAVVDDRGVRSVPPASMASKLQVVAGVGLLALAGAALLGRRKDS